jgi:hypothetical protein
LHGGQGSSDWSSVTVVKYISASNGAARTRRAAGLATPRAWARTAMTEDWPPGAADRWRAILVSIEAGEKALARAKAAIAMRAGELSITLVAGIAAIGRIALPLVAINFAAATATAQAAAQCAMKNWAVGQQAIVARPAAAAALSAAGFAWAGSAFIAASVPGDRVKASQQWRQPEAARGTATGIAGGRATETAAPAGE